MDRDLSSVEERTGPAGGAAGDFQSFYRAEFVRLARALLLLTGDPAEAEDLAQEALVRIFERWQHVGPMESPTGYLYRTALNLHRSRRRRIVRSARRLLPPGRRDPMDVAEDRQEVLRAVADLPRGQREALVLVEWLGLETAEAGRVLGIAPASVRGRLHRARQGLRERLGAEYGA